MKELENPETSGTEQVPKPKVKCYKPMTRKPKRKKVRSLTMDLKLRSVPSKAGQIIYEEEGIPKEQGKESLTIQANMFSSRSKSFSKKKEEKK